MRTTPSSPIFAVMLVPALLSRRMYRRKTFTSCFSYSERLAVKCLAVLAHALPELILG